MCWPCACVGVPDCERCCAAACQQKQRGQQALSSNNTQGTKVREHKKLRAKHQ